MKIKLEVELDTEKDQDNNLLEEILDLIERIKENEGD
jgi:quinol monooxygenase YgiN|tara:strand:+ start:1068 stop:1178 length:111 start_codon:yes stop_codon:yes gene_type:complete